MKAPDRKRYEKIMSNLLLSFSPDEEVIQTVKDMQNQSQLKNNHSGDDQLRKELTENFNASDTNKHIQIQFTRSYEKSRKTSFPMFPSDSFHNEPYMEEQPYLTQAGKLLNSTIFTIETILFEDGQKKYPNLLMGLARMYQIKKHFRLLLSLDDPIIIFGAGGETVQANYSVRTDSDISEQEINAAIRDYFLLILLPLSSNLITLPVPDEKAQQILGKRKSEVQPIEQTGSSPVEARLFPNKSAIAEFQVPQSVANDFNRLMQKVNQVDLQTQYRTNNRTPVLKIQGPTDAHTELHLDQNLLQIKTAEEAAEQLLRIRDPLVIQTFFALWKYAAERNSVRFRDTPISEIMKLRLKASDKVNYNTKARRVFTKALNYLAAITLTVRYITEREGKKGKSKPVLRENRGIRLFKMEAEYAVKKQFQGLLKEELLEEHFDRSVITRFSGQLIPENDLILKERGHIYFDSLLHLDANKDETAIILGFAIQTRFNQHQDKTKYLTWDRGGLIEICNYAKTDAKKPAVATQQLRNTLDKLIAAKVISSYEGLTNINSDFVKIYPPKLDANLIS